MEFEVLGNKDTRSGFGEGLAALGEQNPNVVALCADLTGSLKWMHFKRHIQTVSFKRVLPRPT